MLSKAIEREDHNWQLYCLRARVEREAGERRAAAASRDIEHSAPPQTAQRPRTGEGRRMSQPTQRRRPAAAPTAGGQPEPRRRRATAPPARARSPSGSQQRGALLRRLLATGDWLALIAALCVVTAASSSADVATLFWAVLFSPILILVFKLHGLYDNDHRRIRHSTLDELPALISASVLGVLALDGLLALSPAGSLTRSARSGSGSGPSAGSFILRGASASSGTARSAPPPGLIVGPPLAADQIARRVSTHPEARLTLVGYLSASEARATPRRAAAPGHDRRARPDRRASTGSNG